MNKKISSAIWRIIYLTGVFFVVSLCFSCASVNAQFQKILTGRVCSPDGRGIEDCVVKIDGKKTITDSRGYFFFTVNKLKNLKITGGKKGWSSIQESLENWDGKSVVFIQLIPFESKILLCEKFLKAGMFDEVDNLLMCEKENNGNEKLYKFFLGLYNFCLYHKDEDKENLISMAGEL